VDTPEQILRQVFIAQQTMWAYKLDEFSNASVAELQKSISTARQNTLLKLRKYKKGSWSEQRANDVLDELDRLTAGVKLKITDDVGTIAATAGVESLKAHESVISFGGRVGINKVAVSADQLKSFFLKTPVGGSLLSEWVDKAFSYQLQDRIKNEIGAGVLRGEGYRELAARIRKGFDNVSRKEAETLVRTYVQSANVGAMNAVYDANTDIVKGREWSSVMEAGYKTDGRGTCPRCAALDGEVFTDKNRPVMPLHPNCYRDDVEVYTNHGFKLIKDVKLGERCLSLNPESLDLEYVSVVATIAQPFEGELVRFHSRNFELSVTPNHSMFVKPRNHKRTACGWRFVCAEDVRQGFVIYRSSEWSGADKSYVLIGDRKLSTKWFVQFMAWWLSDGSIVSTRAGHISISQDRNSNPKQYDSIVDIVRNVTNARVVTGDTSISFVDHVLYNYLKQFGHSFEKYIPDEIKMLSKNHLRLFLDTYAKGDGYSRDGREFKSCTNFRSEISYFTTSKKMADDIGELLIKVGRRPSFGLRLYKGREIRIRGSKAKQNHNVWVIRECYNRQSVLGKTGIKKSREKYKGFVYCVQLEKFHTLLVRQNGKVCWSGNCRCVWLPVTKSYRELGLDIDEIEKVYKPVIDRAYRIGMMGGKLKKVEFYKGDYASWYLTQPPRIQRRILGRRRADLIRDGIIDFKDIVDLRTGRLLTLKELGFSLSGKPIGVVSEAGGVVIKGVVNRTVFDFIRNNPEATKVQIVEGTGLADGQVRNALYKLKKEGFITTSGRGRFVVSSGTVAPRVGKRVARVAKKVTKTGVAEVDVAKDTWRKTKVELDALIDETIRRRDVPSYADAALMSGNRRRVWVVLNDDLKYNTSSAVEKLRKLAQKEFDTYVDYVSKLDYAKEVTHRQQILRRMIVGNRDKHFRDITVNGTMYVPFRMLADLERRRFRVMWIDGWDRAACGSGYIKLYTLASDEITVAHEFGHALDNLWSSSRNKVRWLVQGGGEWVDNGYVTTSEGEAFREWFGRRLTGRRLLYRHPSGKKYDYIYWEDEWIDQYEGRHYDLLSGEGHEWISMQAQRYSAYYNSRTAYYARYGGLGKDIEDFDVWFNRRARGAAFITAAAEDLKIVGDSRNLAGIQEWFLAREKYPEFTKFLEKKFMPVPTNESVHLRLGRAVASKIVRKDEIPETVDEVIKSAVAKLGSTNDIVLSYIKNNPNVGLSQIASATGLRKGQVRNAIYKLKNKWGKIKVGSKRGFYVVVEGL